MYHAPTPNHKIGGTGAKLPHPHEGKVEIGASELYPHHGGDRAYQ